MKKTFKHKLQLLLFLLVGAIYSIHAQVGTSIFQVSQAQGVKRIFLGPSQYFSDNTGEVEFDRGSPSFETKYRRYQFSHPNFLNSDMTQVVVNITFNKTSTVFTQAPGIVGVRAPDLTQNANASWSTPSQTMIDAINFGNSIFTQGIGSPNNGSLNSVTQAFLLNSLAFFDPNATDFTIGFNPIQDGITITAIDVSISYNTVPIANNSITGGAIQIITCSGAPSLITGSTPTGGNNNTFTFQWQYYNTVTSQWQNVPNGGAGNLSGMAINYQPPTLTQTRQYRRLVNSAPQPQSISNVVTITVNPPAVPTGVVVQPQSTSVINVSWNQVASATSYQVYNCSNVLQGTVLPPNTIYQATGLSSGTTYQYKVVAVCTAGSSAASSCVSGTTGMPISNNSICCAQTSAGYNNPAFTTITGSAPAGGIGGSYTYAWESDGGTGNFGSPVTVGNAQSFTPPAAQQTIQYRRKVMSGPTSLIIDTSVPVSMAVTAPPVPTGLTAVAQSPTSIQLNWTATPGAVSYKLYDCTSNNLIASNIATTGYLHTGLTFNTTYNYYVVAVCGALVSPNSACASATTPIPPLANNTICCNQTHMGVQPSTQILGSIPTGGLGVYSYQWESGPTFFLGFTAINGATGLHYTPPANLTSDVYYRRVVTSGAQSIISNLAKVTIQAPAVPAGLVVTTQSAYSLLLTWNAASGAVSYRIYDCSTNTLLQTVNALITTAVINGLTPSTSYQFYVVAVCGAYASAGSPCATGVTAAVPTTEQISTIAGNGMWAYTDNVFATQTGIYLLGPGGLTGDAKGNIYFADQNNMVIRKIDSTGTVHRYAGTVGSPGFGGDGGPALNAKLDGPAGMAFDAAGNLYFSDMNNHRIRKIDAVTKIVTTVAGAATQGFAGDGGPATAANLSNPSVLAVDALGNVYFFDWTNYRVRKIDGSGIITTVAGNGTSGYAGDGGAPSAATIGQLRGLTVRGQELFLCDFTNHVIRRVDFSLNMISTYAGTGNSGYSGNGGPATSAQLSFPYGMCFDPTLTDLYISDAGNSRVRKIDNTGTITDYAGNGSSGFSGDGGQSISASFANPATLYMNQNGLYISDNATNNRIRLSYAYCYANAGPNVSNNVGCCGGCTSVRIGSEPLMGLNTVWTPPNNLSCSTCNLPQASSCNVNNPTTYNVTVSGNFCTTRQAAVTVFTQPFNGVNCCRIGHFGQNEEDTAIVENAGGEPAFKAYPNPSDGHLTVELYSAADFVQILDLVGRSVYKSGQVSEGKLNVDITGYKPGIYIIIAKIGGKIEKSKLVKE